jgi:hypothetical protein
MTDILAARPPGRGSFEWELEVRAVVDLGGRRELAGTVEGERLRVPLPDGEPPPAPGSRVRVHAAAVHEF